jgi:hypothetical protein
MATRSSSRRAERRGGCRGVETGREALEEVADRGEAPVLAILRAAGDAAGVEDAADRVVGKRPVGVLAVFKCSVSVNLP